MGPIGTKAQDEKISSLAQAYSYHPLLSYGQPSWCVILRWGRRFRGLEFRHQCQCSRRKPSVCRFRKRGTWDCWGRSSFNRHQIRPHSQSIKNLHCHPCQNQCNWISWAPELNWLWLSYRVLLLVFKTPLRSLSFWPFPVRLWKNTNFPLL